jgi:hypothetical protein
MTPPGCTLIAGKSRELAKEYLDNGEKHKTLNLGQARGLIF